MPRDANGTYTLPYSPVIGRTEIAISWANGTLDDIATEITDSLSRSGKGSMNTALKYSSGSVGLPGITFTDESGSGFYLSATNDHRASLAGNDTIRYIDDAGSAAGNQRPVEVWNGLSFQPIIKGDNTESPTFGSLTTSGALTVSAGGVTASGGLVMGAGGLDVTGDLAHTDDLQMTTLNSSTHIARGYVLSAGTIQWDIGVASVSRFSTGLYYIGFDAPILGDGLMVWATVADYNALEKSAQIIQASGSAVYVTIADTSGVRRDSDFCVVALLTP